MNLFLYILSILLYTWSSKNVLQMFNVFIEANREVESQRDLFQSTPV